MLKFHVFTFDSYYPGGGVNDLAGSFATAEEAQAAALDSLEDHYQIVESLADGSLKVIKEG
jgi:hypothetical protein